MYIIIVNAGKVFLVHAMKAGSGGIAPIILNLTTK